MNAENRYLKFIFSFSSGEQVIYDDITRTIRVTDSYYSPFLVAPEGGYAPTCECERTLSLSTTDNIAHENYLNFQTFCNSILNRRKQSDEISGVCIISSDGEVFYNLLPAEIMGVRFGGNSHDGVLHFNLEIFLGKGE